MAAFKDPETEDRLKNFRDFCIGKGWRSESGRWAVTEIAQFFGRQPNQISDYLNGTAKSFGPTVANSLAKAAGLQEFYFEPKSVAGSLSPVAYELARTFDNFGFDEEIESAAYNAAVATLVKFLKPKSAT